MPTGTPVSQATRPLAERGLRILALEIDPRLADRARHNLGAFHADSITVDARGLTFIDSSGLTALLRAREAAVDAGVAFRLSARHPPFAAS